MIKSYSTFYMQREKVMAEIINFVYVTILFLFFFHVATISAESHECDIAADCPPHMYLYKATCVSRLCIYGLRWH
ncbi:putative Late nodulin [Medicago truncatula]|uniref:Putative Late nodulin n=1 Tax=Medicago truncatula TaxID=3880 RepID=A0A396HZG3_MEDTR|nr:putative Late nodulin [Medicago truncatula]